MTSSAIARKQAVSYCPECGQPIIPPNIPLPPVKSRIFDLVRRHPGIAAETLRCLVWASDPSGGPENHKTIHVHIHQLNRLLAPHGIWIRDIPIPTVASIRRVRRRIDRRRRSADRIIAAMRDEGAALHCSFENRGLAWWLSDGARVPGEVAQLVVINVDIASVGDALFENTTAQTYRFTSSK